MSGNTFRKGDRVTVGTLNQHVKAWMVGHPATVVETPAGLLIRLRFDDTPPKIPVHNAWQWTYCTGDGWYTPTELIVPLNRAKTTHEVW